MRPHVAGVVAWGLCLVTAVGALLQFALRLPHLRELAAEFDPFLTFPIVTLATLAAAVVGAVIASRQPRNPVGWLFCAGNCLAELGLTAEAYAELSGLRPEPLPGATYAAWIQAMTGAAFALSSLVFLLLLFPDGRLPSPRWRVVAWIAGANLVALEVLTTLAVGSPAEAVPMSVAEVDDELQPVLTGAQLIVIAVLLAAVWSVVARRRRATGDERQQLKLVTAAATALAAAVVLLALADPLQSLGLPRIVPESIFYLAYGGLPVAAGLAILKYRLYDIDVILNRAVVFAILAVLSTAGYVAAVVAIGAVLGERLGSGVTVSMVATALVAVAVQPLRQRAHRFADRLVYGERATPYEVLATFSQRLGETLSVDEVLPRMAAAAAQGVGARAASVRLVLPDGDDRTVRWPDTGAEGRYDVAVPVVHAGETVGEIALETRPGRTMDRYAARLVTDLAGQAGLALRNVRLTTELRRRLQELSVQNDELSASRQRLLTAQTVERQRFERQISSDVRPHLAAITAGIGETERLLAHPASAAAAVDGMSREATAALEALREIARGVFPRLLEDRGLLPALEAAARVATVPVTVTAEEPLRRFPFAAEAAAYFCCAQVLAEAARSGAGVQFRLSSRAGGLDVEVLDAPGSADLVASIHDRVGAAGGTVTVTSGHDRRLRVQLPRDVPAGIAR